MGRNRNHQIKYKFFLFKKILRQPVIKKSQQLFLFKRISGQNITWVPLLTTWLRLFANSWCCFCKLNILLLQSGNQETGKKDEKEKTKQHEKDVIWLFCLFVIFVGFHFPLSSSWLFFLYLPTNFIYQQFKRTCYEDFKLENARSREKIKQKSTMSANSDAFLHISQLSITPIIKLMYCF